MGKHLKKKKSVLQKDLANFSVLVSGVCVQKIQIWSS